MQFRNQNNDRVIRHLTVKHVRRERQKRYNQVVWRSTAALPGMRLVSAETFHQMLSLKKHNVMSCYIYIYMARGCWTQLSDYSSSLLWCNMSALLKLRLFRNWTVAEALQCTHAGRRCWEKAVYRHRSGERGLWGQRGGTVFTAPPPPGAASEPREFSVLNPSRSLVPRPGQGRGEGREGGSSRPQRTPTNLERGQTKLSILYLRCNEWINQWMNEWRTNTSPKPSIIILVH